MCNGKIESVIQSTNFGCLKLKSKNIQYCLDGVPKKLGKTYEPFRFVLLVR